MSDGLASLLSDRRPQFGEVFGGLVSMAAWLLVYLALTLAACATLAIAATGWDPVVVTGGSMAPTIRAGDILLVDEHPVDALVGQRAVLTFRSPGSDELITHRVFAVDVENNTYVTKGDANLTPDVQPVTPDQVVGVGRFVVPILGLPVVWLTEGNYVPLAGLLVAFVASLYVTLFARRKGSATEASARLRTSAPAILGIRRARLLVALLISFQFVFQFGREDADAVGLGKYPLLALTLLGLGFADLLAQRGQKRDRKAANRLALAELAVDTTIVVLLVVVTGQSRVGWLLMALPLVEASVHFRLAGTMNLWMAMTGVMMGGRMFVLTRAGSSVGDTIDELEQLLDQLGALLLVAIPGAFLAEQLIGDIRVQRGATEQAVGRGLLLGEVSEIGREINRLGSDLFETLAAAASNLGFDAADVWLRGSDGVWQPLYQVLDDGSGPLPSPWDFGGGMRPGDLEHEAVIVDGKEGLTDDYGALAGHGYRQLVRFLLVGGQADSPTEVAVRVAKRTETPLVPGSIEAYQLLVAQAVVALENDHLVRALQSLNQEMDHRVHHDQLTGLANRRRFLAVLGQTLARAQVDDLSPAVLFCDLNGFKNINDTLGHEAGDELLVQLAKRLVEATGEDGLVARLGGDEFTVLLPQVQPSEARLVANRIHAGLRTPFDLSGRRAEVGTSIGVAMYRPGLDTETLMRQADAAMYASKRESGSAHTTFFSPGLVQLAHADGRLAADLSRAMAANALTVLYQPVVDVQGTIIGVDTQLRWEHPELDIITSERLLDIASAASLIDDLNAWYVAAVASEMGHLGIDPNARFHIWLNISGEELEAGDLAINLNRALQHSRLDRHRLVVQLREDVASVTPLADFVAMLPDTVGFSVDEFGRNRLSLQQLSSVPVTSVRVDPLLVQRAARNDDGRLELASVVASAGTVSALVVAAGVEEGAQNAAALACGANALQGFGLYRPVLAPDLAQILGYHNLLADAVGERRSLVRGQADGEPTSRRTVSPDSSVLGVER